MTTCTRCGKVFNNPTRIIDPLCQECRMNDEDGMLNFGKVVQEVTKEISYFDFEALKYFITSLLMEGKTFRVRANKSQSVEQEIVSYTVTVVEVM